MNKPHKWAEVIKAWADGKEVQCAYLHEPEEWISAPLPNFHSEHFIWRIKPESLKYRRYLFRDEDKNPIVQVVNYSRDVDTTFFERLSFFIRWIDTEWQEVEV